MRKVILSMMVSVDGFTEARDPTFNWHNWNEEMDAYMMDFFQTVDTFIYGRKAYQDMLEYWPAMDNDFAKVMNKTPKIVFSTTLQDAEWNTRIVQEDVAGEIIRLKKEPGKNLVLFAGANLAETFISNDLIDEYRLIVNPVILAGNKPLFSHPPGMISLQLRQSIPFACGNVLLVYVPLNRTNQ